MSENTPTPWKNTGRSKFWKDHFEVSSPESAFWIAHFRNEEDAHYAVRAVNNHQALVEALTMVKVHLMVPKQHRDDSWQRGLAEVNRIVCAALAKATE